MKKCNFLQEFVHKRCSDVHHLHGQMPRDAFCTGQLQCQIVSDVLSEIGP